MIGSHKTKTLSYKGTRFFLDDEPFYLQGVSFFNAIYNSAFNKSPAARLTWLKKFKDYGVNTLRFWCQLDLDRRIFTHHIDVDQEHTLYTPEGGVREDHFQTLSDIIMAANSLGMVIEVAMFINERSQSYEGNLPIWALERAALEMTQQLMPYRNVIMQIWNENSTETRRFYETIKKVDLFRIVTNSPGKESNFIGTDEENAMLDILTPHTIRQHDRYFEVAPQQVAYFLEKYKKPVIDDEPARTGTLKFGGREGTTPEHHIQQIEAVRGLGGYHIYHHDMFQMGYGDPSIPPSGIPDPEFSPYHKKVFEYLRDHRTW